MLLSELQWLQGGRIKNIYSLDDLIVLKGRSQSKNFEIVIEPGRRIHLTEFKRTFPQQPSDKVTALRKHLREGIITSINQHGFDRIVLLEVERVSRKYMVIIELFGKGNLTLVDKDSNRVIFSLWYRKMRDRDLLPGKNFHMAPSRDGSILDIEESRLKEILKQLPENEELVRSLALHLGSGGPLAEEILFRAGLSKNLQISLITEEQIKTLINTVTKVRNILAQEKKPYIVLNELNKPISFHPFVFQTDEGFTKDFESFNHAIDHYFSPQEEIKPEKTLGKGSNIKRLQKTLTKQEEHLQKLQKQAKRNKEIGDLLWQYSRDLQELLEIVSKARKKGLEWEEIKNRIELAKEKGINSAQLVKEIIPQKALIVVTLDNEVIELDFRKPLTKIAEKYYEQAKKAERKIVPAISAIEEMRKQLEQEHEKITIITEESKVMIKKHSRYWYEKYHWSFTPKGFLVIGGTNAKVNQELVRKRLNKQDFFFHADIRGAAATILFQDKTKGNIGEVDLDAAARISACYSSAWKTGQAAAEVYYVTGEQVSLSAPSGEYLPKGGIMVRGKKTTLDRIPLQLAVGITFGAPNEPYIIVGPPNFIEDYATHYVLVQPGDSRKSNVAKIIKSKLEEYAKDSTFRALVKSINLNDIVSRLPGPSRVEREIREGKLNWHDMWEKQEKE